MDFNKIKKIHLIGIGGIGVSAVARMMCQTGKIVSGSNLDQSVITDDLVRLGIEVFIGHDAQHITPDIDLIVYSPAVSADNPERLKAKQLNIPELSYPEFLGEISKSKFTIAVSGTNGKSTTTAMLGLMAENFLDPTVIVGSKVLEWNSNLRLPQRGYQRKSAYLIVEACEWRAHMLNLSPKIIVLTNLEEDHLDYYRDISHLQQTFQQYINKLTSQDLLIINRDDVNLRKLEPACPVLTYAIDNKAEVMARNIKIGSGYQELDLVSPRFGFDEHLKIKVPGKFNIYNCLAAISTALFLGVPFKDIREKLGSFHGIWRRFQVGLLEDRNRKIEVIHDYAHTPSAVKGTIAAAKEFFPNRRLIAVFQPHHHNRTKKLFNDFVKSFDQSDITIISEIYDVAGREEAEDRAVSSRDLVNFIQQKKSRQEIYYTANLLETKNKILEITQTDDAVLIMGAGDIYTIFD